MNDVTKLQLGMLSDEPTVSVCMIVRDEEEALPRCLKSVQSIADELIVVDTGSKDNTVSIVRDFGARVFHFEWCEDWAAARNESLKYATGEWIFQIDADEELLQCSIEHLRQDILEPTILCYFIRCDNGPTYRGPRFGCLGRLFRNLPGIRYRRPYHESVQPSVEKLIGMQPRWKMQHEPNITIRHYGYEPRKMHEKWKRGLRIMKSYLKKNPNDAYILTKLGGALFGLERYHEAEMYLNKALEIDPSSPQTNYNLGLALEKRGKQDSAIRFFMKAMAGDPLLAEAYTGLGAIYIQKGILDEAVSVLESAIGINPELAPARRLLAEAHVNSGATSLRKGMLDNAISELKSALAVEPDLAWGRSNLGLAYIGKGMYDEAIAELKKAVAIDAELASAHMNLGMAYTKKGMLHAAVVEYEKALAIDPNYAKAHYNLAITYYKQDHYKKAIEHCDKANELGAEIHPKLLEWLEPYR